MKFRFEGLIGDFGYEEKDIIDINFNFMEYSELIQILEPGDEVLNVPEKFKIVDILLFKEIMEKINVLFSKDKLDFDDRLDEDDINIFQSKRFKEIIEYFKMNDKFHHKIGRIIAKVNFTIDIINTLSEEKIETNFKNRTDSDPSEKKPGKNMIECMKPRNIEYVSDALILMNYENTYIKLPIQIYYNSYDEIILNNYRNNIELNVLDKYIEYFQKISNPLFERADCPPEFEFTCFKPLGGRLIKMELVADFENLELNIVQSDVGKIDTLLQIIIKNPIDFLETFKHKIHDYVFN